MNNSLPVALEGTKITINFISEGFFEIEIFSPNSEAESVILPLANSVKRDLENRITEIKLRRCKDPYKKGGLLGLFFKDY